MDCVLLHNSEMNRAKTQVNNISKELQESVIFELIYVEIDTKLDNNTLNYVTFVDLHGKNVLKITACKTQHYFTITYQTGESPVGYLTHKTI